MFFEKLVLVLVSAICVLPVGIGDGGRMIRPVPQDDRPFLNEIYLEKEDLHMDLEHVSLDEAEDRLLMIDLDTMGIRNKDEEDDICRIGEKEYVFDVPEGFMANESWPCEVIGLNDEGVMYTFISVLHDDIESGQYIEVVEGVYEFIDYDSLEGHMFGYVNWRYCETGVDDVYLMESDWDWDFEGDVFVIDKSDHVELDEFVAVCKSFKSAEI
jgi:hypothetical protein